MHYRLIRLNTDNLLACTGLTDKNGKLIYEGDIVKTQDDVLGVVKWNEYTLRFYPEAGEKHYGIFLDKKNEVVGNIYENPELVKDTAAADVTAEL